MEKLKNLLKNIDKKGFKAYKEIAGNYVGNDYNLEILNVQGDPFASPTMFEWSMNIKKVFESSDLFDNKNKKLAFEDYLLRHLYSSFEKEDILKEIQIIEPKEEILKRSAIALKGDRIFIKYYFSLPAKGRNVLGVEAYDRIEFFAEKIKSYLQNLALEGLKKHIRFYENIEALRETLKNDGIKTFIGNGTILEFEDSKIIFEAPKTLEKEYVLGTDFSIKGMALKEGISVITGYDYQAKTALFHGIMEGVYNHIQGSGKEFIITDKEAVNIVAEKGRSINGLDMSSFIRGEEKVKKERSSSSLLCQTANLLEAVEVGKPLLLIDEDSSVSSFLHRDKVLKEFLNENEYFTPFVEKINEFYVTLNISSIIVTSCLEEFIPYATEVLLIKSGRVYDITYQFSRDAFFEKNCNIRISRRKLDVNSNLEEFINKKSKIKTEGLNNISFGKDEVNLYNSDALIHNGQLNYIGELIKKIFTRNELHGKTLKEVLEIYEERVEKEGIEEVLGCKNGSLIFARKYEVAAVINRFKKNLYV